MCQAVNKLTCVSLWLQSACRHIQQVHASCPWLSDSVVGDLVLGTRAERGGTESLLANNRLCPLLQSPRLHEAMAALPALCPPTSWLLGT